MPFIFYFLIGKLLALSAGFLNYNSLPKPYKLILYTIAIASLSECYGYYLGHYLGQNNMWFFNLYMPVEFLLVGMAGIMLLVGPTIKAIFSISLGCFLIIWAWHMVMESKELFATTAMMFGCVVLTLLFIVLLVNNFLFKNVNFLAQPIFWLSISSILFYGCNIPNMGLRNYVAKHLPSLSLQLAFINTLLDIIRYPLVAISFILLGRQKQVILKSA